MNENTVSEQNWSRNLLRIYVSGLVILAIAIVIWKVVFRFTPWFDVIDNPLLASVLTALSLVLLPLVLGGIVKYGLNPLLMGKWNTWSELVSLQDRHWPAFLLHCQQIHLPRNRS